MKTFKTLNFPYKPDSTEATPWELWRHENIDAEDAATLHEENPWETREELLARKSEAKPVRKAVTPAMTLGKTLRPDALAAYRNLAAMPKLHSANIQSIDHPWMIAHPDLMLGYHIADVHCGESSLRRAHASGKLPKPYWAEAQHTMMVADARMMTIYLHSPVAGLNHKIFEVRASKGFQAELFLEEKKFRNEVATARAAKLVDQVRIEEAKALDATIKALRNTGPRVPIATFRKFVPTFLDRTGQPTNQGAELLALLA